jgi:hypothetical protein
VETEDISAKLEKLSFFAKNQYSYLAKPNQVIGGNR